MSDEGIVVFTQPGCMFCAKVKDFLVKKGIDFNERDVTRDESALDEIEKLGLMSTPITMKGDEVVVGYDEKALEKLLGV